jgi:putative transposase
MPRKPRFTLPGIPQHVIQRGNNREPCFLSELDYRRYLEDLHASAEKQACRIHAYVLMTNHVHLLVTPMQEQRGKAHCRAPMSAANCAERRSRPRAGVTA